ncbi:hypothetical protein TNCV_179661 [Trichonephila clavipes]|nr:hypothetical protein TNCV_179661 [Trichonephila clavipes]
MKNGRYERRELKQKTVSSIMRKGRMRETEGEKRERILVSLTFSSSQHNVPVIIIHARPSSALGVSISVKALIVALPLDFPLCHINTTGEFDLYKEQWLYPPCPNCNVTQATPAHNVACIGCHKSQLLSSPATVLHRLKTHGFMDLI